MKRRWKLQFQGQGGAETSIDIPHLMVALPRLGLPGGCVCRWWEENDRRLLKPSHSCAQAGACSSLAGLNSGPGDLTSGSLNDGAS